MNSKAVVVYVALVAALLGAGCKSESSRDAWASPAAWNAHKPVVSGGHATAYVDAPEFLHWRQADRSVDGFSGKVLTVTLTGPFADDAWSQHAGALFSWPRQIPIGQPFPVTFMARSLTGPKYLTVLRTWGGALPREPIPITSEWKTYHLVLTPESPTNSLTLSLVAGPSGLQTYCAGSFEISSIVVDSNPRH